MGLLWYLTTALLALWCVSELAISLFSAINRWRGSSKGADRFSFLVVWISLVPTFFLITLTMDHVIFLNGVGSFAALAPLLGYLGCLIAASGLTIRLVAVATLRKQFTTTVAIVAQHEIIETGIYRSIRHPAYLGLLATLLGFGLASGNWLTLAVAVVLPTAGILYRIHVEERALLSHFGPAYQEYAGRTKRLLPGIY
jgi:protein-S-isoprenylcysteine O-methyltransferase Ste14